VDFLVNRHTFPISGPALASSTPSRPDRLGSFGAAPQSPWHQTRRKGLSLNIQIDLSPHRNVCILQFRQRLKTAAFSPAIYCAFIQVSDPLTLTATSDKKICRGLPSAVPRCSVENNSGPAFL
jgi:hypothetical protein